MARTYRVQIKGDSTKHIKGDRLRSTHAGVVEIVRSLFIPMDVLGTGEPNTTQIVEDVVFATGALNIESIEIEIDDIHPAFVDPLAISRMPGVVGAQREPPKGKPDLSLVPGKADGGEDGGAADPSGDAA